MGLFLLGLSLLFVTLVVSTPTEKKKKDTLSEQERYNHMVNYLDKFSGVKEARPMVNKIKNSEEFRLWSIKYPKREKEIKKTQI